jgi:hypothetical protein
MTVNISIDSERAISIVHDIFLIARRAEFGYMLKPGADGCGEAQALPE